MLIRLSLFFAIICIFVNARPSFPNEDDVTLAPRTEEDTIEPTPVLEVSSPTTELTVPGGEIHKISKKKKKHKKAESSSSESSTSESEPKIKKKYVFKYKDPLEAALALFAPQDNSTNPSKRAQAAWELARHSLTELNKIEKMLTSEHKTQARIQADITTSNNGNTDINYEQKTSLNDQDDIIKNANPIDNIIAAKPTIEKQKPSQSPYHDDYINTDATQ